MNSKKYIIEILKNNCNTVELKINLHKEIDLAPFKKNKVYFIEDTEELYMYMYIDDDGVFYKIDINEFIKYSKMKILVEYVKFKGGNKNVYRRFSKIKK